MSLSLTLRARTHSERIDIAQDNAHRGITITTLHEVERSRNDIVSTTQKCAEIADAPEWG